MEEQNNLDKKEKIMGK